MGYGYNQGYVQEIVTVETTPRAYYNQPMIVQPQPQVIIVEDPYYNNQVAAN